MKAGAVSEHLPLCNGEANLNLVATEVSDRVRPNPVTPSGLLHPVDLGQFLEFSARKVTVLPFCLDQLLHRVSAAYIQQKREPAQQFRRALTLASYLDQNLSRGFSASYAISQHHPKGEGPQ